MQAVLSRRNLAAFTPPSYPYPPYLSVNELPNGDVEVTVRGQSVLKTIGGAEGSEVDFPGRSAAIVMTRFDFAHLLANACKALGLL